MKSVAETLTQRVTVRRYERQDVDAESMQLIYDAIRATPTSYNGQQYSVIDVADPDARLRLYDIIGQKQIKTCSHFLAFCADFNKIGLLARAKGIEMPPITDTLDGYTLGVIDASLAMMNAAVAAESRGLGCCCIGYARTVDPKAVAEALGLPQGVMVVCGLSIGVPREHPEQHPRQPQSLLIHHDRYRTDTDDMTADLLDYDARVQAYNESRPGSKSSNDWSAHIIDYYREALSYKLLQRLRERGFDITE